MDGVKDPLPRAAGTGKSVLVDSCQVCSSRELRTVLFLGFLPPVNTMSPLDSRPAEQPSYPAELLYCPRCGLVQLGLVVDPGVIFPPDYAYTSGTTRILRENFAQLYQEVQERFPLEAQHLVVDIGSNDGTLLANFLAGGHRVLGIEPTGAHKLAQEKGITCLNRFFDRQAAAQVVNQYGQARLVTATNVFAHMEGIHQVVEGILDMLAPDGLFVSESHYLLSLLETLQYDTIYHEHLRYYSLRALRYLLEAHGLEIVHARPIPTHGGSIRVYAARRGTYPVSSMVEEMLRREEQEITWERLREFRSQVAESKLALMALLHELRSQGARVYGIGAPSRATTLVNYVGLDDAILERILEIPGSHKIGRYLPGTLIPVVDESCLFQDQPDYALLLSWHIARELMPKLRDKGYEGRFIIPLSQPRVVEHTGE